MFVQYLWVVLQEERSTSLKAFYLRYCALRRLLLLKLSLQSLLLIDMACMEEMNWVQKPQATNCNALCHPHWYTTHALNTYTYVPHSIEFMLTKSGNTVWNTYTYASIALMLTLKWKHTHTHHIALHSCSLKVWTHTHPHHTALRSCSLKAWTHKHTKPHALHIKGEYTHACQTALHNAHKTVCRSLYVLGRVWQTITNALCLDCTSLWWVSSTTEDTDW